MDSCTVYRNINNFILDYDGEMPEELKTLLKDSMRALDELMTENDELRSSLKYAENCLDVYSSQYGSLSAYDYLF